MAEPASGRACAPSSASPPAAAVQRDLNHPRNHRRLQRLQRLARLSRPVPAPARPTAHCGGRAASVAVRLVLPSARTIVVTPAPSAHISTIRARHTNFCGVFRSATQPSSRARSSGDSRMHLAVPHPAGLASGATWNPFVSAGTLVLRRRLKIRSTVMAGLVPATHAALWCSRSRFRAVDARNKSGQGVLQIVPTFVEAASMSQRFRNRTAVAQGRA